MIVAENLSFAYRKTARGAGEVRALAEVGFRLEKGESLAVVGPSGCGKTTLLYLLCGLLTPSSGSLLIDSQLASRFRKGTSIILQDYGLLPWKTVKDNVALGLQIRGMSKRDQAASVDAILSRLGLYEFKDFYPAELSGGQQQRVAVSRSLVTNPDLLLMDEAFSALDALTREDLQNFVLEIWRDSGITLVFVTHSIEEAVFLGTKIALFSPRPGKLKALIENPGVRSKSYRRSDGFYKKCTEVREAFDDLSM